MIDAADEVTEVPAPPAPPPVKKTIEQWATGKGMLPQIHQGESRVVPRGMPGDSMGGVSVNLSGLRGPRANAEFWKFAAAKAGSRWPEGFETTEAEFDAAVKEATEDHQLR